ncbi:ribosome-associated GTPase EngA [Anopheles sinensis]|uniref:Ribosome-associated GTPase EngA n=1 Tax=Anopheles sinensis TaxID=74873 RepID=A0A084VMF4_ANOSI|nr:ribosome-associated GTPase EngA [Anopheles sinensis]
MTSLKRIAAMKSRSFHSRAVVEESPRGCWKKGVGKVSVFNKWFLLLLPESKLKSQLSLSSQLSRSLAACVGETWSADAYKIAIRYVWAFVLNGAPRVPRTPREAASRLSHRVVRRLFVCVRVCVRSWVGRVPGCRFLFTSVHSRPEPNENGRTYDETTRAHCEANDRADT